MPREPQLELIPHKRTSCVEDGSDHQVLEIAELSGFVANTYEDRERYTDTDTQHHSRIFWDKLAGWSLPEMTVVDITQRTSAQRRAVQAVVTVALLAGHRPVVYSRDRASYARNRLNPTGLGYVPMMRALHELDAEGYIVNHTAPPRACERSWFVATDRLLALLPDPWMHATERWVELVELRDADGNPVDYRDTAFTGQARRQLRKINEAIASLALDLPDPPPNWRPQQRTLRRIFNRDWNHGGRMYGGWWIGLRKNLRTGLLIDGEPTALHDYAQFHPRLLYAQAGQPLIGDAYTLDGFDRETGKLVWNVLLNARNWPKAREALEHHEDLPPKTDVPALIRACKAKHRDVAGFLHSGEGLRLQRVESDLIVRALLRLLKCGVVALPVHDCLLAAARHHGVVVEVMEYELAKLLRSGPSEVLSHEAKADVRLAA